MFKSCSSHFQPISKEKCERKILKKIPGVSLTEFYYSSHLTSNLPDGSIDSKISEIPFLVVPYRFAMFQENW